MLVITGCGECETESKQLGVAYEQLREQGNFLQVRSTLVRMMALFAASHCFRTSNSETVESRQKVCLHLQQILAKCMVGALHAAGSWLPYVCLHANAYPSLLSFTATLACCTSSVSSSWLEVWHQMSEHILSSKSC